VFGRRQRRPQPALLLPPPGALRLALVADGLPAAQWPRDRYGQKHQPQIVYLFTDAANEKSRATCASWKSSNARTSRPP
jgi:hypothetical protein